jgi:2-polyprenyl-6-methoxyphenol hydroxylase-like FAD-dependent oxidoreductase
MTQVKNILVVGGGIGGQSVAIALKKAGFEPEIVEIHQELTSMELVLFNKRMPFALSMRLA